MNIKNKSHAVNQSIVFLKAIIVGFFGGLIWSALFLFMHTFKMTEVNPFFLLKEILGNPKWLSMWYAYFILIISYGVMSIFVAIVYYFLFKQMNSWLIGATYGVILWFIWYYILPVLITGFNPFFHYETTTHIALFCILLLYGVFIGYSISYDNKSLQKDNEQ